MNALCMEKRGVNGSNLSPPTPLRKWIQKNATSRHECSEMKMGGSKPDVCIAVCFAKAGPVSGEPLNSFNSLIMLGNIKFRNFS
jgi:hypothetical protein